MIDDDQELSSLFREYLETEGGFVFTARYDGQDGVTAALSESFDVIVCDVTMPKMNGFDVLRAIRQVKNTPVIMLTARGDDLDRILGLEFGADDYVPKPCNLRELVARIRAIMRRTHPATEQSDAIVRVGDVRIEPGSQSVFVGHNAPFDWSFVAWTFAAENLKNPFGYKALDTKALAMGVLDLHWINSSKDTIQGILNLPLEDKTKKHRADYDAEYQALILIGLLNRMSAEP